MRTAGSRPQTAVVSFRTLAALALGCAGMGVFALVIGNSCFQRTPAESATTSITVADAFGLGGLARLSQRGNGGPSAIEHNRIVTYYGTPRTPSMGILGQHSPEEVADLLAERAARFQQVDPTTSVLPALHLVFGVAQPGGAKDSLSVRYVDDRTVRQFIDLARRRGFALILDVQIGHSNALAEVRKVEKYLEEPDVFIALDPEFALDAPENPGEVIGSLDAGDINAVQWYLAALTAQHHLPNKMLIVHQFQPEMITDTPSIERRTGVDLVIDMDGYGPADIKQVKYARYGGASYAAFGGIKVFLEHDPEPFSEQQLLALKPTPSLVVFQ